MTNNFVTFLQTLERQGLTDVLLPFILIFTIVFAILQKTEIIGKGKKNFNSMIALVMALMVVIPHVTNSYPPGGDVVEIINSAIPNVSLIVVAIIMLLLLIGLFGGEASWTAPASGWIAIISFIIIVAIFGRSAGWFYTFPDWLWFLEDPDTQAMIIIILIFGILIWFITREENPQEKERKFISSIGDFFSGGKN